MKSENPDARSMRDVISLINNEKDFENYILDLAATVPLSARSQEVKYERHPVRISTHEFLFFSTDFPSP
jgi:hypothetical protein